MTPAEVLSSARAIAAALIPAGPAAIFAEVALGVLDAILSTGSSWRKTAELVHDVVRGYRAADAAGRDAMHARWREHAVAAVAAVAAHPWTDGKLAEASTEVQAAVYPDEPKGG